MKASEAPYKSDEAYFLETTSFYELAKDGKVTLALSRGVIVNWQIHEKLMQILTRKPQPPLIPHNLKAGEARDRKRARQKESSMKRVMISQQRNNLHLMKVNEADPSLGSRLQEHGCLKADDDCNE